MQEAGNTTQTRSRWDSTTAQVNKFQVHCILEFPTRACAKWAWTDGVCFRLRCGRTVHNATRKSRIGLVPLKPKLVQPQGHTTTHYSQKCLGQTLWHAGNIVKEQWQLPHCEKRYKLRLQKWLPEYPHEALSVLARFPDFSLLDFRYCCSFVHHHSNCNRKATPLPSGCLIRANVQIATKWSALAPLKTHVFWLVRVEQLLCILNVAFWSGSMLIMLLGALFVG